MPDAHDRLHGRTVAVIDDSIIRGNNSAHARKLLYEQGHVKKAYLISYTPPVGIIGPDNEPRGCLFGVDMPINDRFIARNENKNSTVDEISKKMGMEVKYLSVDGMLKTFEKIGLTKDNLCYFCIGGEHPFKNM